MAFFSFFLSQGYWQGLLSGITLLLVPFCIKQYSIPIVRNVLGAQQVTPLSGNWKEASVYDPDNNRRIETTVKIKQSGQKISGNFSRIITKSDGSVKESRGDLLLGVAPLNIDK